ncbi:DoxX family protein [Streptomyces sp. MST-110588]|uniref:DoxX family protein n=1 Tax=Streptomyces sp. MST-110588 TaxID=2833628 RepID=UPI001F5C23D9|nr:DoxX family protein [Streptomyces sp. MST-110588]UNO40464.1 DoxX family membrane protein [Streptomyces sp. MST-110588]
MSVDTRTPRTPTGGRSPGFDDEPVLSSVKVPCDPAQVIVNHASFRVRLAAPVVSDIAPVPVAAPEPAAGARRRAPVVWSGRTEPGAPAAATTQLLHAVRNSGVSTAAGEYEYGEDVGATQVLPRVDEDGPGPSGEETPTGSTVIGPRGPADTGTALLKGVRPAEGAYDEVPYGEGAYDEGPYGDGFEGGPGDGPEGGFDGQERYDDASRRRAHDAVRHAYYPGRRMNLGVVLLPLRVFLGLITVYAGMGKLCDPVYFDGGKRGSMVKWLTSLHPWELAVPLRDLALSHPVGAGLTVAFLQVVVGVLTMCGLWQRLAASIGALLSAALLMTVSWRNVPVYDAPDIIYLAAWSPLVIAGAPVYSMDARLAGEAWRRLGPRVELSALRRRVLRRGATMTGVVAGLTLLVGSVLGGAVRSSSVPPVPRPGEPATNNLPGSPLPRPKKEVGSQRPSQQRPSKVPRHGDTPSAGASSAAGTPTTPVVPAPGTARATGSVSGAAQPERPSVRPPRHTASTRAPAPTTRPPASAGGTGGGTTGGTSGGSSGGSGGGGSSSRGTLGGLFG